MIVIVAVVTLFTFYFAFLVPKTVTFSQGAPMVEVIEELGPPDNQFVQTGLQDLSDPDRVAFGLQWGHDPDGDVLPGGFGDADISVWFNDQGRVIRFKQHNKDPDFF